MIGVFDSGLGGLTVVRELQKTLPDYDLVYFGDTARTPYGTKGAGVIKQFMAEDVAFLKSRGARIVIAACNTASAVYRTDASLFPDITCEVVGPAVRRAIAVSKGRIGVIGTTATIESGVYQDAVRREGSEAKVFGLACPLFVPLVEEGWVRDRVPQLVAKTYLDRLRLRRIDTLILGCTHFPFLRSIIGRAIGSRVRLIDPARETVRELASKLAADPQLDRALSRKNGHQWYLSDCTPRAARIASKWLGHEVSFEQARIS